MRYLPVAQIRTFYTYIIDGTRDHPLEEKLTDSHMTYRGLNAKSGVGPMGDSFPMNQFLDQALEGGDGGDRSSRI